jgi:hypothetical protein
VENTSVLAIGGKISNIRPLSWREKKRGKKKKRKRKRKETEPCGEDAGSSPAILFQDMA